MDCFVDGDEQLITGFRAEALTPGALLFAKCYEMQCYVCNAM